MSGSLLTNLESGSRAAAVAAATIGGRNCHRNCHRKHVEDG